MKNIVWMLTEEDVENVMAVFYQAGWTERKKKACIDYVGTFIDFEVGIDRFYRTVKKHLNDEPELSVWEAVIMLAILDFEDDYEDDEIVKSDIKAEERLQNIKDGYGE